MPKQYTYTGPVIKPFTKLRSYDRDIVPSIWTQEQIQKWLIIEPRYAQFFTEVEDKDASVFTGKASKAVQDPQETKVK